MRDMELKNVNKAFAFGKYEANLLKQIYEAKRSKCAIRHTSLAIAT